MENGHQTDGVLAPDETSPLIHNETNVESQTARVKQTPLPVLQLAALCTARIVDPIAFSQIFPYINELIINLHIVDDPTQVGFYSGVVESAFAFAQMCSIYQWARLSDVIGRRPVVLIGILGVALSTISFGFSRTFVGILASRFIGGLFSGNVAVVHSVLCEITDNTNQAAAFPVYGLIWPLGSTVGPLIGGTFSNPAKKFPKLFDNELMRTRPYLLSCLLSASVAVFSVLFSYRCLDETLPSKKKNVEKGNPRIENTKPDKPLGMKALLLIPVIWSLCAAGAALSFISTGFDVVFVLFCYSPIRSGGLGFSPSEIGFSLAMSGIISVSIQVFIMPKLLRTFSVRRMYIVCIAAWPYAFAGLPVLNLVARLSAGSMAGEATPKAPGLVWCGIIAILFITRIGFLGFAFSMILTKENVPNASSLGSSNGLVQFAMCIARAFSPFLVSSLFTISVDGNILGSYLWVLVMVGISCFALSLAKKIPQ